MLENLPFKKGKKYIKDIKKKPTAYSDDFFFLDIDYLLIT